MQYLNKKKMSQCDFVIMICRLLVLVFRCFKLVQETNFDIFDVLAFRSIRLDETNFLF